MKHLNYELLDDFLDFDGRFDGLPDISEDYYRHLASDLIARLDLDYLANVLNLLGLSADGETISADDGPVYAADLRQSIEIAFDELWDLISDNTHGINKIVYSGCWVITYDYRSTFYMTVSFFLSSSQYYSRGDAAFFL